MDCPACQRTISPSDPRISWFTKDDRGFTTDRGAVHLACVAPPAAIENRAQLDIALGRNNEVLAYVDKSIDNIVDLSGEVTWQNREVIEMLEDIRSLLLTGAVTPGSFPA